MCAEEEDEGREIVLRVLVGCPLPAKETQVSKLYRDSAGAQIKGAV